MPPEMITNVMPTLTPPIAAASRSIVEMLLSDRNVSGAVTYPTTHSAMSTPIRIASRMSRRSPLGVRIPPVGPVCTGDSSSAAFASGSGSTVDLSLRSLTASPSRLHCPSACACWFASLLRYSRSSSVRSSAFVPHASGAPPSRPRAVSDEPAPVVTTRAAVAGEVGNCPRRTLRRSRSRHHLAAFHDHVEHGRLRELARRRLGEQAALTHHQHPVGQTEHLRNLAGHQHHGHPRRRELVDQPVQLGARPHVHAARRLVQQQDLAVPHQP